MHIFRRWLKRSQSFKTICILFFETTRRCANKLLHVYWQTFKTQHLDSHFNVCLEKRMQNDYFDCMFQCSVVSNIWKNCHVNMDLKYLRCNQLRWGSTVSCDKMLSEQRGVPYFFKSIHTISTKLVSWNLLVIEEYPHIHSAKFLIGHFTFLR